MNNIMTETAIQTPKKPRGRPAGVEARPRGRPRKVVMPGSTPAAKAAPKRIRAVAPAKVEMPISAAHPAKAVTPLNYIFTVGRRKRAVAKVFFYRDGKGEVEINGKPLEVYFPSELLQQTVLAALNQSPFRNSVRVVVKVSGGGIPGQAVAVQHGITRALIKLDETLRPIFRARGFLTRDSREKERKKPGLKKARKAPQWQKR